jgi:hypothetical protein
MHLLALKKNPYLCTLKFDTKATGYWIGNFICG